MKYYWKYHCSCLGSYPISQGSGKVKWFKVTFKNLRPPMTLALTTSEKSSEMFMLHKYSLAKLNERKVITKAKNDIEPASPELRQRTSSLKPCTRNIFTSSSGQKCHCFNYLRMLSEKQINHVSLLKESPLNYVAQKWFSLWTKWFPIFRHILWDVPQQRHSVSRKWDGVVEL